MTTYEATIISVSIDRDWREVYDFSSVPENFSKWAAGLGSGVERVGDVWIAESPVGKAIEVRFSPRNEFGILDHTVIVEKGEEIENPFRVVANGTGSEITFIVFRRPGMSEEEFAADAAAVRRDLLSLKALLESRHERANVLKEDQNGTARQ